MLDHAPMLRSRNFEETRAYLARSHGIDMDTLPSWWWRGIAAQVGQGGAVEVYDELPPGDAFGQLVPD